MDDLKKQIIKYHKYLGGFPRYDVDTTRKICNIADIPLNEDRSCECCLTDFTIKINTWSTSYHNGDAYNEKSYEIIPTTEILQTIADGLYKIALVKATSEYEQTLAEEKNQKVRAFLATKLLHLNGNGH